MTVPPFRGESQPPLTRREYRERARAEALRLAEQASGSVPVVVEEEPSAEAPVFQSRREARNARRAAERSRVRGDSASTGSVPVVAADLSPEHVAPLQLESVPTPEPVVASKPAVTEAVATDAVVAEAEAPVLSRRELRELRARREATMVRKSLDDLTAAYPVVAEAPAPQQAVVESVAAEPEALIADELAQTAEFPIIYEVAPQRETVPMEVASTDEVSDDSYLDFPEWVRSASFVEPLDDGTVELDDPFFGVRTEQDQAFVDALRAPALKPNRFSRTALRVTTAVKDRPVRSAFMGAAGVAAIGGVVTAGVMDTGHLAAANPAQTIAEAAPQQLVVAGDRLPEMARDASTSTVRLGSATLANLTGPLMRDPSAFSNDLNAVVQWPFPVGVPITDGFGYRDAPCGSCSSSHKGLDMTPGEGTPIGAIADGVVIATTPDPYVSTFGVHVMVEHTVNGQRVVSLYAHMLVDSIAVKVGDTVRVGDQLGRVGNTGASTGPHLHLEVHVNGEPIDPDRWLREHNTAKTKVVIPANPQFGTP